MPTHLDLDSNLLERVLAVSGEKTKTAAVTKALQEFIARREPKRMLEFFASFDWDPECDYKAERSRARRGP